MKMMKMKMKMKMKTTATTRFQAGSFLMALVLGGLVAMIPSQGLAVSSTFDTDLDGWQAVGLDIAFQVFPPALDVTPVVNTGDMVFSPTDGNPGGYARLTDAIETPASFASAPSKFLGDLSAFVDGTLSFDHRLFDTGTPNDGIAAYSVLITSGAFGDLNSLVWTAPAPAGPTDWVHFDIILDENDFSLIEDVSLSTINPEYPDIVPADLGFTGTQDFFEIMSNVTSILVAFELVDNSGIQNQEHGGIDNVSMVVVPEPTSALLLGLGLAGLAWQSGRRD